MSKFFQKWAIRSKFHIRKGFMNFVRVTMAKINLLTSIQFIALIDYLGVFVLFIAEKNAVVSRKKFSKAL